MASMVGGLDLHRAQVTFEIADTASGEIWRGRLWQPDRQRLRRWLAEDVATRANGGPVELAVEGCTGWRYVVEEVTAAGHVAHVAEPADTMAARGRKRHAKTDRSDAGLLRQLLQDGDLPESWIPPEPVLEWRERVRLYKSLVDQRTQWVQRIRAELYHHGVAVPDGQIRTDKTRAHLADPNLAVSPAARQRILAGYAMIEATDAQAQPLKRQLTRFGERQPACRALIQAHYGIGGLIAVAVWSELGDCQRFARSLQVVRHTGLDVTVDQSDRTAGAPTVSCPAKAPRLCAGRSTRRPRTPPTMSPPTTATTRRSRGPTTARSPPSPSLGNWPGAATTPCALSIPTWSMPCPDPSGLPSR
jgi:transposase